MSRADDMGETTVQLKVTTGAFYDIPRSNALLAAERFQKDAGAVLDGIIVTLVSGKQQRTLVVPGDTSCATMLEIARLLFPAPYVTGLRAVDGMLVYGGTTMADLPKWDVRASPAARCHTALRIFVEIFPVEGVSAPAPGAAAHQDALREAMAREDHLAAAICGIDALVERMAAEPLRGEVLAITRQVVPLNPEVS